MTDLTNEELDAAETLHDTLAALNQRAWVDPNALAAALIAKRMAQEIRRCRAPGDYKDSEFASAALGLRLELVSHFQPEHADRFASVMRKLDNVIRIHKQYVAVMKNLEGWLEGHDARLTALEKYRSERHG